MRKSIFLAIILAIIVLIACGCASNPSTKATEPETTEPQVSTTTSPKTPNDTQILSDLEAGLAVKNPFATITGTETVKSLTEEKQFTITINLTATSKYADWTYQADLKYTKYDQGWINDEILWSNSDYTLCRYPDIATMTAYAEEYLQNHEVYSDIYLSEYMTPMIDAAVQYQFCPEVKGDALRLMWKAIEKHRFFETYYDFTAIWLYEPSGDCWILAPDNTHGSLGYHLAESKTGQRPYDSLILNGTWGNQYISFNFSDFSWDSFTLTIPGHIDNPETFKMAEDWVSPNILPPKHLLVHFCDIAFVNDSGNYITFKFYEKGIEIYYFNGGATYNGYPWSNVWWLIEKQLVP